MAAMCSPASSAESPPPTSCARPKPWMTKAKSPVGIDRWCGGLGLGKGGEGILGCALAHHHRGPGTLGCAKIAQGNKVILGRQHKIAAGASRLDEAKAAFRPAGARRSPAAGNRSL